MIVEGVTPAADSLHPGGAPSDGGTYDPTKSEVLAQALAVLGGMSKDDINGFMASLTMTPSNANITAGNLDGNRNSIVPHASFAVGRPQIHEEDIKDLFEGQEVSEEFIEKAKNIFEAALETRLAIEVTNLQEQYENYVNEAYGILSEEMEDKLDQYLNYVVSEWMEENELVLENGVRNEIMEDFIVGLKSLFEDHYIDVPENEVSAVEMLSAKVAELEDRLNAAIDDNIELEAALEDGARESILDVASADLSEAAEERLRVLAENVDFESPDAFAEKVDLLKENLQGGGYFNRPVPRGTGMLVEDVFLTNDEIKDQQGRGGVDANDPVSLVANHISRNSKKA